MSKAGDAEAFKGVIIVQVGSLDDNSGTKGEPGAELYVSKRLPWLKALEGKGEMKEFS